MKGRTFIPIVVLSLCYVSCYSQTWTQASTSYVNRAISVLKTYNDILYLGGPFTGFDTTSGNCSFSAEWNGATLSPHYDLGISGYGIYCMEVHNATLFSGGRFSNPSGAVYDVAEWDGAYWHDPSGTCKLIVNASVNAMKSFAGKLYIGGDFNTYNSVNYYHVASNDGTGYSTVGSGFDGTVSSFAVYNNELYAGGGFFNSGSSAVNHIARWNNNSWQPLGSGINGSVTGMTVLGNELYAVGSFTLAGSASVNNIAKWNGTSWSDVGGGLTGGSGVRTILSYNNAIYVGGEFTMAGSVNAKNVAMWDGISWSALDTGLTNIVNALEIYKGDLYAGLYSNPYVSGTNYLWTYPVPGGIKEYDPGFTLNAYYSPSGSIVLDIENTTSSSNIFSCNIYNTMGQFVFGSQVTKGHNELHIDQLGGGVYFCEVGAERDKRVCKIAVLKR